MVLRLLSGVIPMACCGFLLWDQLIIPFHWAAGAPCYITNLSDGPASWTLSSPCTWPLAHNGFSFILLELFRNSPKPLSHSCLWDFSGLACHLHSKSLKSQVPAGPRPNDPDQHDPMVMLLAHEGQYFSTGEMICSSAEAVSRYGLLILIPTHGMIPCCCLLPVVSCADLILDLDPNPDVWLLSEPPRCATALESRLGGGPGCTFCFCLAWKVLGPA